MTREVIREEIGQVEMSTMERMGDYTSINHFNKEFNDLSDKTDECMRDLEIQKERMLESIEFINEFREKSQSFVLHS